jgi:hypothetical protein
VKIDLIHWHDAVKCVAEFRVGKEMFEPTMFVYAKGQQVFLLHDIGSRARIIVKIRHDSTETLDPMCVGIKEAVQNLTGLETPKDRKVNLVHKGPTLEIAGTTKCWLKSRKETWKKAGPPDGDFSTTQVVVVEKAKLQKILTFLRPAFDTVKTGNKIECHGAIVWGNQIAATDRGICNICEFVDTGLPETYFYLGLFNVIEYLWNYVDVPSVINFSVSADGVVWTELVSSSGKFSVEMWSYCERQKRTVPAPNGQFFIFPFILGMEEKALPKIQPGATDFYLAENETKALLEFCASRVSQKRDPAEILITALENENVLRVCQVDSDVKDKLSPISQNLELVGTRTNSPPFSPRLLTARLAARYVVSAIKQYSRLQIFVPCWEFHHLKPLVFNDPDAERLSVIAPVKFTEAAAEEYDNWERGMIRVAQ